MSSVYGGKSFFCPYLDVQANWPQLQYTGNKCVFKYVATTLKNEFSDKILTYLYLMNYYA